MKINIALPTLLALQCSPSFSLSFGYITSPSPKLLTTFLPQQRPSSTHLHSSSESSQEPQSESGIEGNRREPTPQEISIMDEMITKLSNAKPYELPNAVSRSIRVVSSPRFFLRIAERADMAETEEEKERLSALASNLISTLEAVVSTTEEKMDKTAKDVENVLKASAEPDSGEFLVPLSQERIDAMREVVRGMDSSALGEGFLATVDSWMNKSMQDGMDGMVGIFQKALQIYAGVEISRARTRLQAEVGAAVTGKDLEQAEEAVAKAEEKPASILFEKLLAMDTDLWDQELNNSLGEDVSAKALMGEVQRTIEGVVLGLESGSMTQRVQAEYLRELVTRIEKHNI